MTAKVKRRLTTVMCADVEGYTRLMAADEAGTLARLRRAREAMAKLAARHDGRIVNTWGDAVIAEFASVVEAVQCAVETQQELSGQDGALPEAERMRFRIGINLGDVMVEGEDVYGDGVNVAARLQQLAEPGGIVISGPVYDQVHNKLAIGFDRLGPQQVKNVASPVMSYRVVQGDALRRPAGPRSAPVPPREGRVRTSLARAWAWYLSLPRAVAVIGAIAGFFLLINVLTSPKDIWFHWPVLVLVFLVVLWKVIRRKES
jgi:adenylate cyclase